MNNTNVSPIDIVNASISAYNPFINAGIVKEQDVWGKGFPDVPTLNAHASDTVFQAIELVRSSQSSQEKVTSIAITAQQGVGKTHILSRIRHQLPTENEMNVITPETLQKLVELQNTYKNSINLLELKERLQQSPFGLADDKVNSYINKIEKEVELRSHIIQFVKEYSENTGTECTSVDSLHGFIAGKSLKIQTKELHEILIELSSPLTGYLGRIKGDDWKRDRFYFLRNLPIN